MRHWSSPLVLSGTWFFSWWVCVGSTGFLSAAAEETPHITSVYETWPWDHQGRRWDWEIVLARKNNMLTPHPQSYFQIYVNTGISIYDYLYFCMVSWWSTAYQKTKVLGPVNLIYCRKAWGVKNCFQKDALFLLKTISGMVAFAQMGVSFMTCRAFARLTQQPGEVSFWDDRL